MDRDTKPHLRETLGWVFSRAILYFLIGFGFGAAFFLLVGAIGPKH